MKAYDLIVIGGGLVGGAIAWGAARQGASVALLDEGDVAYRAARGNFGLVWVQSKGAGMPPYAHWSRRSSEVWPQLAAALLQATELDVALRQPGGLHFCLNDAELEARAEMIQRMHNESGGSGTRMVGRAEMKAMVPAIGDGVVGASYCPIDGHANPLKLLRALHAALLKLGGAYLPGRTVDAIAGGEGGGFTLQAGAERFACAKLVIAAGLGSRKLAPMVGLDMPVTPLRGQIIVTERMRPFLDYATHVVRQTDEGSVLLGDSQEDVGFDNGTTVPVMQDIAARNLVMFPGLKDANIVRVWGALRVMTPDGYPIYEQSRTHPGAFAATCHSGVTLAGAHALELAPAILAGALPSGFDVFSSRRFHVQAA
ncbi:NAD(P)/FAD-dependent oxidoreductase [Limobrevibacterium gyesilva]|uniref:FAD-binding oxidoreductase n=1 Tax=Limobrevibacterium gyesilva TaxID=2991712 RepID=A0AA42CEW9_9PROT|nr:FAD-dependent oxidoreductase [Limobrevibacterium gyesilva]MCW3474091.1 FAD-binding oxidoreductase [Limobrevibacterium gyesilva]